MRKHIDYFYKCYDKNYDNSLDKIYFERYNEYGYNFSTTSKKRVDIDEYIKKTNYQNCLEKISKQPK